MFLRSEHMKKFAMGRLAKKKNIPGFSRDFITAVKAYNDTFPAALSRWFIQPEVAKMVKKVPVTGQKRIMAQNMVDFYFGRKNPEGKINRGMRNALYMYYLIAKPAFGAVNLTQRITLSLPWAHHMMRTVKGPQGQTLADNPMGNAYKFWGKAQTDEFTLLGALLKERFRPGEKAGFDKVVTRLQRDKKLGQEEANNLRKLHRQGELRELRVMDIGGGENSLIKKLDFFGVFSERSNRIHATLMGTKMFRELGFKGKELTEMVDKFTLDTQFLYGKANRAEIARGGMAVPFVFKSFMFNYLEALHSMLRQSPQAFAHAMGLMVALAGTAGLPLYTEEIEGITDYFATKVAGMKDWHLKKEQLSQTFRDNRVLEAITYGIPSQLGIDSTALIGFPSFSNVAIMPLYKGLINLPKNLTREDMSASDKLKVFYPAQAKKLLTLWKLMKHGRGENQPTTPQGKPYITERELNRIPEEHRDMAIEMFDKLPRNYSTWEKTIIALGFPAKRVSEYYNGAQAIKETGKLFTGKRAEFHRAIGKALANDDWVEADRLEEKASRAGLILDTQAIINAEQDFP